MVLATAPCDKASARWLPEGAGPMAAGRGRASLPLLHFLLQKSRAGDSRPGARSDPGGWRGEKGWDSGGGTRAPPTLLCV